MNVADGVGLGEDQKIVVATQVAMPILEARAAKAGFVELQILDHRAHGAVEHENALARRTQSSAARSRGSWMPRRVE